MYLQERLVDLLRPLSGTGHVSMELAFRALPEHELRIADVAYVSTQRWEKADPDGYFHGAPDLVVGVLSPSNTVEEMLDNQKLCLENGAAEFWVVDAKLRQVMLTTQDRITRAYEAGQEIPLGVMGSSTLNVAPIFD